ncbi:hypothetical protein [Enterococcus sp. DIV0756]|uniref:hypothetical protein n=1 Tax=Enterococcus sp. DIV0756 TaxID=2774636 RepID=UPI003F260211
MNSTQTIKTVAGETNESIQTVESILNSYENYCNKNITRYSRKHMAAIVEFISNETLLSQETCSKVMNQFFDLVKSEIKGKFFN